MLLRPGALVLELPDQLPELLLVQGIFSIFERAAVQVFKQGILTLVRLGVQAVAVDQVIEDLQVHGLPEKRFVFFRILLYVLHKLFFDLAGRSLHDCGRQDRVYINGVVTLHCMHHQVKAFHTEAAFPDMDPVDRDPVVCDLVSLVFIFYAEPFSLMYCFENILSDPVHTVCSRNLRKISKKICDYCTMSRAI